MKKVIDVATIIGIVLALWVGISIVDIAVNNLSGGAVLPCNAITMWYEWAVSI